MYSFRKEYHKAIHWHTDSSKLNYVLVLIISSAVENKLIKKPTHIKQKIASVRIFTRKSIYEI